MSYVSIILLNYNGKSFNKSCIDSILKQDYDKFEILFVDNNSTDSSLQEVKDLYPNEIQNKKIIIIESKKNLGFAGGNNLGTKYVQEKSDYICLLNNDTTVSNIRLKNLVRGIESDPKLGGAGSIILEHGMESQINNKIFNDKTIISASLLGEGIWKNISNNEFKKGIFYTSVISGCCFLYKKSIIKQPFEDYYFAYAEDFFLSRMIILQGYKLAIIGDSTISHIGSGSFGKEPSDLKLFHGNKNQIINFLLFYDLPTKIILLPLFLLTQIGHIFINSPIKRLKAKYKSWIWIYNNWTTIKETRQYIRSKTLISRKTFLSGMSYKFSDEIFFIKQKKRQIMIVKVINNIFKIYCKLLFIPHSN